MSTATATETPKAKLDRAASILFCVASKSHTLREMFGIEETEVNGSVPGVRILRMHRRWLTQDVAEKDKVSFDADAFAAQWLDNCSDYSRHMVLFILNVWNSGYAKNKGWTFDLFSALNGLDQGNREAIAWWLKHPIWP
jgi:hypothetical protein